MKADIMETIEGNFEAFQGDRERKGKTYGSCTFVIKGDAKKLSDSHYSCCIPCEETRVFIKYNNYTLPGI